MKKKKSKLREPRKDLAKVGSTRLVSLGWIFDRNHFSQNMVFDKIPILLRDLGIKTLRSFVRKGPLCIWILL